MSRVCTIHGPRDLRLDRSTMPALGPHDVALQLGAGGICGSDLHYFQHGRVGAFQIREPLIPGHEASGVVLRIGDAVRRVAPGQKVAINPARACGGCDYCRAGRLNLCRQMHFVGSASVFPHAQGLFREQFVMHEAQLTAVDGDISLAELACAEPLSVGLHAVQRAGPLLGKSVLITGGGTIGCMVVMSARLAGAAEVTVCDIADRPLQVARCVGADRVLRTGSPEVEAGVGIGSGSGSGSVDGLTDLATLADSADIAIEAAGSPAALATCLQATRRGGRIVQVGSLPPTLPFAANSIMVRELEYVGAFRANHEFDWAVQALRSRRVDVRPLISAQLPLSQALAAFELAADRSRSTKVQLVPG